jgi:hypothetical protein
MHKWLLTIILVFGTFGLVVGLANVNARSIQPGRYQMQASNTYVYVLDTATGKMHAYRMKLDVMDEICIQYTPRCNDDN